MGAVLLDQRTRTPAWSAPTALPKPGHRADVQGLRALAVLLVVLYHAGFGAPGGFVGVDMFFVISGFVITRQLMWEHATAGRLDLRRFFSRRIRRILPAVSLTASVTILATVFIGPLNGFRDARDTAVAAVFVNANNQLAGLFGRNRGGYFTPKSELNPFLHTWSLSVEEQFYLVFPFLVAGAGWLGSRRDRSGGGRWISVALAAVVVASFAASLWAQHAATELAFYLSPLRAWEFGAGALLIGVDRMAPRSRRLAGATALAGAGLVAAAVFGYSARTDFPGLAATLPVGGTVLLVVAGSMAPNPLSAALAARPATFVGGVSYSWYLWHWPLLVFASATFARSEAAIAAAVLGSLAVAAVSTHRFENPIRFADRTPADTLRLAGVCVLAPLAAIALAGAARTQVTASDSLQRFQEVFAPHWAEAERCDRVLATDPACTWPVDDASGSALLLGDSNAHHFVEGFVAGMHQRGYTATLAFVPGCPFADLEMESEGVDRRRCNDFVATAMADLTAEPFDLVVLATAMDVYVENDEILLREPVAGRLVHDPESKARLLAAAYRESFGSLARLSTPVVFVRSIPELSDWYPHDCSVATWMIAESGCGAALDRASVDPRASRGSAVEHEALASSGLASIELTELLCENDRCAAYAGGRWRWKDWGHLTVDQSRRLAPIFAELVAA